MLQYSFDERTENALITEGILTHEQLTKARKIHEHMSGQKSLPEVLLEMNFVSNSRLDEFIRRHRSNVSLSDMLIARRLVTQNDVMAAREVQRKSGPRAKRIGEILIEMGLIEERHVIEALSEKFGLPIINPDISQIDGEFVRRVSLKYLRRQIALPIKLEDGQLQLLVADPTRTDFIAEITQLFNCRVQLALATSALILQKLDLVDALLQGKGFGNRGLSEGQVPHARSAAAST